MSLPQLQNSIKRDPRSYKEEWLQQWNHWNSIRQIFLLNPNENATEFRQLCGFIAQTCACYPNESAGFPTQLSDLLLQNYGVLTPDTRQTLVQNLIMLRNKNVIDSIHLLKTLFPLLPRTSSSTLRASIRKTILSDIRTANSSAVNHKLNRAVQAMLFSMVESGMDGEFLGDKGKLRSVQHPTTERPTSSNEDAIWAIILTKELWRKRVWSDVKSVSIVALGCFHPHIKVQSASIHFFLGTDEEKDDSKAEDDQETDVKALHHRREINKKTRSGDKKLQKKLTAAKKKRTKPQQTANFPALQLLNDPQTFSEKLYDMLNRNEKRLSLDHKILIMQLLSRVMGAHTLCVLGFYTYILKYLTHHQLRVPAILASLAQSVHELTPPDVLTPVIRKITNEFIHPGVASQVIAAGINSVREISKRQPWAMEEDLLGDLVEYRKSRDKAVGAAARGLLQLYREVNPSMLKRKERGKDASLNLSNGSQPLPFGHSAKAVIDIPDLALLENHLQQAKQTNDEEMEEDENAGWDNWEVESTSAESSSESEGWINVDSDDDGQLEISDSEDEAQTKANTTEDKVSSLATTKILTPADFALLTELRIQAATKAVESGGGSRAKRKLAALESEKKVQDSSQANLSISEEDILGPRKRAKADYLERIASIEKGREGREKYGSRMGKKNKETPSSTTNREKTRNKPLMMILSSGAVRSKKKASLRQKQQKLRAHIEKGKKSRR